MDSVLVSIIIPVYNVEQYLCRCIESVLAQTYDNLEIVLVDDGSTDRSNELCLDFSARDKRIKTIRINNSGPAHARNVGITYAHGKYVVFVDSDDWVSSDYVETLVNGIKECKDLFCAAYTDVSIFGNVLCDDFDVTHCSKEMLIQSVLNGTGGVLWGKIFKKRIIDDNHIAIPENLYMCEDLIFVLKYIRYMGSWCHSSQSIYFYNRMNVSSISRKINYTYIENYEQFYIQLKQSLLSLGISAEEIDNVLYFRRRNLLRQLIINADNYQILYDTVLKYEFLNTIAQREKRNILFFLYSKRKWNELSVICRTRNYVQKFWHKFRGIK